MSWLSVAWAVLASILLLGVVGLPLTRIIGLRGFAMIAVAPAFALTIIGATGVIAPWLGLSWSVLPVILVTVVVGAALAGARNATRRHGAVRHMRRRFDVWLLVALLVGGGLIAARLVAIFGEPDSISQTFDDIFHLNAVRFVLDTGNASSLALGSMTNPGGSLAFYPAAWHGFVSLIVQLSGASIPAAVNAVTLVVSSLVWPLGILLLTRTLFGRSPVLVVSAGLLAASLPVFPILLMDYGVLYPYQLGVALLPVALTATMQAVGLGDQRGATGRVWWAIVLIGVLPGLALAHPGAFVSWLALTAPMVVVFVVIRWRAATTARLRWLLGAASIAYLVIGFLLVRELRPPADARGWPVSMSVWDAVVSVLTVSAWYQVSAVIAAIAVATGILWALVVRSRKTVIALGMYLVAFVLYVTVAAGPSLMLRDALTGPWYNNLPRLSALLPIAMVPLAAYGVACTWAWLARRPAFRRATGGRHRAARITAVSAVVVAAAIALQVGPLSPVPVAQAWASSSFAGGPDAPLLSTDERALLERVPEHVPEGVAIVGSPWTGASLAYALTGRPVLMPHTLMEITQDLATVNEGLRDAAPGDAVCDAIETLGAGFVLDFPGREVHPGEHVFEGLVDLSTSDAVRLVDEQGSARLYEIVACER